MKKLLPRGAAFSSEAESFHKILGDISKEFDRVFRKATVTFREIPGNLSERLESWSRLLKISGTDAERNRSIAARIVAVGGQSPEYLIRVLKKYSTDPTKVKLESDRGRFRLRVYGADVRIKRIFDHETNPRKPRRQINRPLRTWTRNENLITGFESIKHAETEARYF